MNIIIKFLKILDATDCKVTESEKKTENINTEFY